MKLSKYSFLFDIDAMEAYVYNTLSNALIELDKESYFILKKHTDHLSCSMLDSELWNVLIENNILTENDDDDFLKYKAAIVTHRTQCSCMHLTIAPTMNCCFHCHYCFEQYKDTQYMSPNIMDAIVKNVIANKDLRDIHITWFGGEPLMAVPQIEMFYDKLSAVWPNDIKSNVVTTGYHIDENAIRVMKHTNVTSVQITLDGMKDTHNRVKYLAGESDVFERVMQNIELLIKLAPEINVVIRVNLTRENVKEYEPLCSMLYERFKGFANMGIAPAFVLDRGVGKIENSNILFSHSDRSKFILDLANKGIDSPYIRYPEPFFNECAIRNNLAISFDPKGYAYKCWEVIGNKEYAIGKLNDDGILTDINQTILNRQLFGADSLDDIKCSQCVYLPLCNGGCPLQRIENKFEGKCNCTCTYYNGFMVDFLKVHIARKKAMESAEKQS